MADHYYKLFGDRASREPDNYTDRMCKACFLGEVTFVALLSVLGMIIHAVDMWNLLHNQNVLMEDLWRNRVQRGNQRVVTEEMEKNLKFAFSILYFEHYLFMFIAWINKEPMLLIPWLTMESAVLVLETFLFIVRVFLEKAVPSKQELIMLFIIIYSFLQTYCYQRSITVLPGCMA